MDLLKEKAAGHVARIDKAIRRELDSYSWSRFHGPLTYAAEGGKRIRPLMLLLAGEAVGKSNGDPLPVAVAVELLHTESIIHDDIIDQENFRRNRMAFHVQYGYGASMLTADFVFGIILEIASRYADPRVAQELSTAALRMCEGEFWELKVDPAVYRLTKEEYVRMITLKTASLFQTSAKLGAIIGGGDEAAVSSLSSYGLQLGVAYQIQDDIQDWLRESKIPSALSLDPKRGETNRVQLKRLARTYAAKAKQELGVLPSSFSRSCLEQLADFSAEHPE